MRAFVAILTLAGGLAAGCKTTASSKAKAELPEASSGDFAAAAAAEVQVLLKTYNNYALQTEPNAINNDCHPLIVPADPSVPFQGTAILFHGYTNCPQQYNQLAAVLAKKGVQSFVPLAPGHGRTPVPLDKKATFDDGKSASNHYGEFLPHGGSDDWRRYQSYVAEVNRFAKTLSGAKFVSGLSLGGGLATYAYLESPGLYTRALLTSPFYGPAGSYAGRNYSSDQTATSGLRRFIGDAVYQIESEILKKLASDMKIVGDYPMSWGDSCYSNDKGNPGEIGRRGICDFRLDNLSAVVLNGDDVLTRLQTLKAPQLPQVQYIITEWDKAANSGLMRKAVALQQAATSSDQVKTCTYPHEVPHSFFSHTDMLAIADPYWVPSFLRNATNFLAFGTQFPLDTTTPSQEVAFNVSTNEDDKTSFLTRCEIVRGLTDDQVAALPQ